MTTQDLNMLTAPELWKMANADPGNHALQLAVKERDEFCRQMRVRNQDDWDAVENARWRERQARY